MKHALGSLSGEIARVALSALLLALSVATHPLRAAADEAEYTPPSGGSWETADAQSLGWRPEALEAVFDFAAQQGSSGMVIVQRGRLVAERYWQVAEPSPHYEGMHVGDTSDGRAIEDVASVQKSIVSFLAGVARARGKLDFGASVTSILGPGWSKAGADREAAITVRHLLSMSSGLTPKLDYDAPAGKIWRYNTNAYAKLMPVLEKAAGMPIQELTEQWLTQPTGMSETRWGPRPWLEGNADANAIGLQTTARDLARFGLLVLRNGTWNGRDLIGDAGYFAEATASSQTLNPSYGYLWWLNGKSGWRRAGGDELREGSLIPAAPDDLVAAQGALGRKVYVVPSLDLVVTRLGQAPEAAFDDKLWVLLDALWQE